MAGNGKIQKIETKIETIGKIPNYNLIPNYPVAVTIRTLEEACKFIDEMDHDIIQSIKDEKDNDTIRPIMDKQENNSDEPLFNYSSLTIEPYSLSIENFTRQVNDIKYVPTIFDKLSHFVRKKTTPKKLEIIEEYIKEIVPSGADIKHKIIKELNFYGKEMDNNSKKNKNKKSENKKGKTRYVGATEDTNNHHSFMDEGEEQKKELCIKNDFIRYYLADYFVENLAKQIEEKGIMAQLGYPQYIINKLKVPLRRFKTKIAYSVSAIAMFIALTTGILMYKDYREEQIAKMNANITEFTKTLNIDEITKAGKEYNLMFNSLLAKIDDFKDNYWLNEMLKSSYYVCAAKENNYGPDMVAQIERLSEIKKCRAKLIENIIGTENVRLGKYDLLLRHLENYNTFSDDVFVMREMLRDKENFIINESLKNLDMVKRFERVNGYSMSYLYGPVIATKARHEKNIDSFHQQIAIRYIPLEFFSLVLIDAYGSTIIQKNIIVPEKIVKLSHEIDDMGGSFFPHYMINFFEKKTEHINYKNFCMKGSDMDTGLILFQNYYRALDNISKKSAQKNKP